MGAKIDEAVARLAPGGRLVSSQELTGGSSAVVHRVDLEHVGGALETVVVRAHRPQDFLGNDKDVAGKEFAVLSTLRDRGLRVPKARLLGNDGTWLVLDWVAGESQVRAGLINDSLLHMADFLVELHALAPADLDLADLPTIEDPRNGALPYLADSELGNRLRSTLTDRGTSLHLNSPVVIHGDYWPGNLLWNDGHLVAVIDWEDTKLGDPVADLACARIELLCEYGAQAVQSFTTAYVERAPHVSLQSLAIWEIYVSASALATMHHWVLAPGEEAHRRAHTQAFLSRAAETLFTTLD